ncbi:MAG: hypothetical protein ACLR6J_10990 [Parabacteroides merdae]
MTYVEAKNEMGQCTQDDLDKTINLIRERAYRETGIAYPGVEVQSQRGFLLQIIRMTVAFGNSYLRGDSLSTCRVAQPLKNHTTSPCIT